MSFFSFNLTTEADHKKDLISSLRFFILFSRINSKKISLFHSQEEKSRFFFLSADDRHNVKEEMIEIDEVTTKR